MTARRLPSDSTPELLTPQEVAGRLRIAVRTLYRLVQTGRLPRPIRLNRKLSRWRARDIERHLRKLERQAQ